MRPVRVPTGQRKNGTCNDVTQITIPDPDGAIVRVPCGRQVRHAGGHCRNLTDRRRRTVTIRWPDQPRPI